MVVRVPDRPTMSCIYAAFDTKSQQVFRRAMELSTGSVVRVADLLIALSELAADAATGLVPAEWRPARRVVTNEPWLTPMTNEPALRTLLETAYLLARQAGLPLKVTPRSLWQAAANTAHLPSVRSPLGSTPQSGQRANQPAPVRSPEDTRSLIARTLTGWLNVHAEPDPRQRIAALQQLLPLVRQIENGTAG